MEIDINNIDIILCLGCDGCANFSLENSTFIYSNQICDSYAWTKLTWEIQDVVQISTYDNNNNFDGGDQEQQQ